MIEPLPPDARNFIRDVVDRGLAARESRQIPEATENSAAEPILLTRAELGAIVEAAVAETLEAVTPDLEIAERQRERFRARYANDPEYRERQRERQRDRYANDPEYRERMRARYANDPEYRERQRERRRERYHARKKAATTDPEEGE